MVIPNAAVEVPGWLLVGVALGVVLSGLVALAFVVGRRKFADRTSTGPSRDGGQRRRREIRHYLEAIGEPYREDHEVAGVTVAFYLSERDLAITFDARAYFQIQEAGVEAVLIEHELPGASLGTRLPFETPTFGGSSDTDTAGVGAGSVGAASGRRRGSQRAGRSVGRKRAGSRRGRRAGSGTVSGAAADGPRGAASANGGIGTQGRREREAERRRVHAAFAALGLPPDADASDVQSAYRTRVKEVHPDQGGDRGQFQRVRDAYDLASQYAERTVE